MILTTALLKKLLPAAREAWLEALSDEPPKWDIDTTHEFASFLAQVAHESSELRIMEENLNYSAERLMAVWPKRFPEFAIAAPYEYAREKLANYVYANRMGNGDVTSGDGWRYHGRGPIQLTGRDNYKACGEGIGEDLLNHPELLLTPFVGIRSACWFWKSRDLDSLDDDDDVRAETRKINGGETGLARRQALFNRYFEILESA